MGAKAFIKRVKAKISKDNAREITGQQKYNYSTRETREATVPFLYYYAKAQKEPQTYKFKLYDDYYNNIHKTQQEIAKFCDDKNLPFIPAIIPDAYIHVESQIIPELPDFEFNGRDNDMDSIKAKQREYVVRYVLDQNKVEDMNPDNERQLNKLGNAFFKVAFDFDISGPGFQGDITIGTPDCAEIFPDPAGLDVDDCEYIDFSYRIHRLKVYRKFKADFDKLNLTINELSADGRFADTQIYNSQYQDVNIDTLQIIEHWFRQPLDGSDTREINYTDPISGKDKTIKKKVEWEAGDIACSIFIGTKEIRYIPKYWEKTGKQNKHYPFVKYCKIPVAKSFWDKSEIEPIKELIDAADREFSTMLLNDAFNGNDIVVMEDNTMADDSETENTPGAHWKTKSGQVNNVRRLGGLSNLNGGLKDTITFIRDVIKQTVGNFDVNMGDAPPGNVRTLGGLVALKEQGNKRQNIKKADRKAGFGRLYELIDWTALEFFDDNRMIFLGAIGDQEEIQQEIQREQPMRQPIGQPMGQPQGQQPQEQQQSPNLDRSKGPVIFKFNSDNMKVLDAEQTDATGEAQYYFPRVDAKVDVGDGITNDKAMTLQATENIAGMNISIENYKLVEAMADLMLLPNRKEIKQHLEDYFTHYPMGIPKTTMAFKDLPPDGKVQMAGKIGLQIQTPPDENFIGDPIINGVAMRPGMETVGPDGQPISSGGQQIAQQSQQQSQQNGPQLDPNLQQILSQYTPGVQAILGQLDPNELQQFLSQPPEIQQQMLMQLMGGGKQHGR